jgi:hypothetical protein
MLVENGLAHVQSLKSDSQRDFGHIQQGHELPPAANGNQVSGEGGNHLQSNFASQSCT